MEKESIQVRVTENGKASKDENDFATRSNDLRSRFKKPLIFALLGLAFIGCLYLIFSPASKAPGDMQQGLNDIVPQATDTGLQADKQKAYESIIEQEQHDALKTLSDYWQTETGSPVQDSVAMSPGFSGGAFGSTQLPDNRNNVGASVNNYREMQDVLGNFYKDNSVNHRQRKEGNEEREPAGSDPLQAQLALMEKSYQMAAKYLPSTNTTSNAIPGGIPPTSHNSNNYMDTPGQSLFKDTDKEILMSVGNGIKGPVSALRRENDTLPGRLFSNSEVQKKGLRPRNSIRACIHETQIVTAESIVRIRLLESARTQHYTIPLGTVLTARAGMESGRLSLRIVSIELQGSIFPVDISVYDLDGQQGLFVPYSPEITAAQGILGNMGTATGTNVTLNSSAGQQIASDLTKSLVQGVSGYFSKKVTTPKITIKAGHQMYLVSKK